MDNDIKTPPQAGPNEAHYRPQAFANDPTVIPPPAPAPRTIGTAPPAGVGGRKHPAIRDFFSFVAILMVAVVVALLLISFVFRSYEVDGPSMQTTLYNQDKLLIWKVPRTWARITGHQYIPKRGDIIIFSESNLSACGQQGTKQLIKRVIGLPGDHVVVKNNVITIYNKQYPNGFQPDATLPYNSDHHIPPTSGNVDVTLTASQLFVSGDNRPDSCDSRYFGPIDSNQVIGQLLIRLLPANEIKLF